MFCECLVSLIGLLHVSAEGNNALGNLLLAVAPNTCEKLRWCSPPASNGVFCVKRNWRPPNPTGSAGNEHDQHVSHQLAMGHRGESAVSRHLNYPLVMTNSLLLKMVIYSGFTH